MHHLQISVNVLCANLVQIARLCALASFATVYVSCASLQADDVVGENALLFKEQVLPVLKTHCFDCHSHESGEANGGLVLDSLAAITRGGTRGSGLNLENPDASTLLTAIEYEDSDLQMPPDGKIPDQDIQLVRKWIEGGAHVPPEWLGSEDAFREQSNDWTQHWAYLPEVESKKTIDELLREKLRDNGLEYSNRADRRTLVRRIYYDLIGLPPSYAEVQKFVEDERSDVAAFEALVDELLQSAHFGERWARYWMDVARYSDNKGYVFREDREYPEAYKYRDWLINAFNDDMPFDKFVEYQLAADLLMDGGVADDNENTKVAAEAGTASESPKEGAQNDAAAINDVANPPTTDTTDGTAVEQAEQNHLPALGFLTLGRRFLNNKHDIIDDRLDVVSRGLMGMTLACARCHDHKYDPVTQKDYYALYGVFLNTDEPGDTDRWAHSLKDSTQQRDSFVFVRGNPGSRGDKVARRFVGFLSADEYELSEKGSGRLELARRIVGPSNPLTSRATANRIWMHLLGSSLIETPSDLGIRCPPPVQLELLDKLATEFRKDWSVKSLIRRIVLSDCYAQRSLDRAEASAVDPTNALYWRGNRRRLDFESLRDALLVAANELDRTVLGKSEKIEAAPFSHRRTVYAYIDRQNLPSLFRTFDLASPDAHSPGRIETTVPQQGLYLLNSPFVAQQATHLASQISAVEGRRDQTESSLRRRVRQLFESVLARHPNAEETDLFAEFIVEQLGKKSSTQPERWVMGYGKWNQEGQVLENFARLPHYVQNQPAWQGGTELPDKKLGWCLLTSEGGHPGQDLEHAVVKRWITPRDGYVQIFGQLKHKSDKGDGVRASVVCGNLDGESDKALGQWESKNKRVKTHISRFKVQAGMPVDFVTDCISSPSHDSFDWKFTLQFEGGEKFVSDQQFPDKLEPPLDAWALAAQVLLLSNEFVFVD